MKVQVSAETLYQTFAVMVSAIARRVKSKCPASIDTEDLEQVGRTALWVACSGFEEQRAVTFRLYAKMRIRGAMLDFVRSQFEEAKRERDAIRIDEVVQNFVPAQTPAVICDPFVAAAVDRLGGRHAAVIGLRFYSGLTRVETGRRLGISAASVARAERSSIRVLRTLLKAA